MTDADAIVPEILRLLSGPAGPRDEAALRALLHPRALVGIVTAEPLGVDAWIARLQELTAKEPFHEREITHRAERFGPLVHRWSTFEARREANGPILYRGVNSYQIAQGADGRWRILTCLWARETPETPLPARYGGGHDVRRIRAEEARPLRLRVLRPGQPPESVVYPADALPDTVHFGAYQDGNLVGVGTLQRSPDPRDGGPSWQLRGMATAPEVRGQGHGAAILRAAEAYVRSQGAHELWFNARVVALGFYERLGYAREGPEFDIPGIGPHFVMRRHIEK